MVSPVHSGGKQSRTTFEERASLLEANVSWIICHPETGRSHQIRVHLDMLGLPIIGDKRYGHQVKTKIPDEIATLGTTHHMLHARALRFSPAPSIEAVTVEAMPPPLFESLLRIVKGSPAGAS